MDTAADLEGRIDAVGQAVIWLAAALEDARLINGPQLCRALRQMADALDGARQVRAGQARTHSLRGPRV